MESVLEKKIKKKTFDIANAILKHKHNNLSLYGGISGSCLFMFHFYKTFPSHEISSKAKIFVQDSVNKILLELENRKISPSFGEGFIGICWLLEYLNQQLFFQKKSTDNFFLDIDKYVFQYGKYTYLNKYYDLIYGGNGSSLYLCDRSFSNPEINNYLKVIVKLIKKSGQFDLIGAVKWEYLYGNDMTKNKLRKHQYNLGLAHGIPSIITILCKISNRGIDKKICHDLIHKSIKYLNNCRLPKSQLSIFPSIVSSLSKKDKSSRLGWCYGDLGIANTLWIAGETTKTIEYKNLATKIILHSTNRISLKENNILDSSLCHGSAGIAHIYNLFYQRTKLKKIKDAMDYWFKITLDFSKSKNGLVGYRFYDGAQYIDDISLLNGIGGVGLASLSYINKNESYSWDKCILLNI